MRPLVAIRAQRRWTPKTSGRKIGCGMTLRPMLLALAGSALLWAHGGGIDAQGHPGGLAADGCHNDRKNGNYHFHRGPLAGKTYSSKEEAARALRGHGSRDAKPAPKSDDGFTCGSKTTCGQMSSCEEARFYLNQCGLSRLDGDKDGTPCESLCR